METTSTGAIAVGQTSRLRPWLYVLTGFVALIFGVNMMNVLFNVLSPSLVATFRWNRLQISSGLSIFTVCDGIGLLALGFLVDRYGIRIATPMAILFGVGIMVLSLLPPSLTMLYVICAFIGLGAGAVTPTVYSIVVTAWFERNRGLALGVLNVGLGLCGTVTPFIVSLILKDYGWRSVFVAMGAIGGVLHALAYIFVVRMPKAWEQERLAAKRKGRSAGMPMSEVIRHRVFWLICFAVFFVSASTYGMMSQMVSMTIDRGFPAATAVAVLSAVSLSSIASRFVVGALLDRMFAPLLTAIIFAICTAGVIVLSTTHSLDMLYVGAVCIGLGLGAEGDIVAYIISRYIPKQLYARVLGVAMFLFAQGGAFGIFALSSSYTLTGSYKLAIIGIAISVVIAGVLVLCLGPYKYETDGSETAAA
ncbi:MFS transporter [Caballeronia sp. TF1N1]|uniref:MFS transporter n=1 Tax=Caballeronia sp. TF1N1 TaxID=2878153 RepID=UPI001FD4AFFC|nr:MFS transporter [Caballeronia sp. TF1N1]